ncbi:U5 small nuclear ribonucleoprotein helicase [Artemisia annua]|uniref:RNA helicase n=1 Tax=Artemisia annua TaxID=35608 RepID=A0A2U1NLZ5_ARTAN|nr:U5 small nuclear ribonucleoprotein helicase [Artemisia annua]
MENPSEKELLSLDSGTSNTQYNSCLTYATDSQLTWEPESEKKKGLDPLLPVSFINDVNNRESKRQRLQEECIFTSTKEEVYEPQIIETQASYEEMLSGIQQPLNIDTTAADEKKVVEKLVYHLPNVSDQLVSPGSFVTDFHDSGGDTIGSAVTYGEDDESHLDIVQEHDEEEKRLKDESGGVQMGVADMDTENGWLSDQRQLLDLESIALCQDGSCSNHKKGYEEVHVPVLKPKPLAADEKLVLIKDMPSWAQPAFKGMTELNRVQSRVYETALFKAENLLLSAPTGAGKTNVAILTILQQIGLHMDEDGSFKHGDYKIVYVAPIKALVAEVVAILSSRLKHCGVTVMKLTGDQYSTSKQIEEAQIIVTTPEKWDKITRKSGNLTYTRLIKLIIIDEIHVLNDERGPVLESIVARTVRQVKTRREHIRLVGLSTTIPNYDDVALFLRVDLKKGLFHFDNSYRHVPLSQHCIGITLTPSYRRNEVMNEICYEKVIGVAGKYQVLIFVHSRNETTKTVSAIRNTACAKKTIGIFCREDSREILHKHSKRVTSKDLKDLLPYGLAIHHAGLYRSERELVEELFADGHIQILVSTTTLSKGVNLPAHTVIIKGTQRYNSKNVWTEFCPLDVMQMLSRAGKPQYDNYSEGIIITGHSELQYYLTLMNQQLPIESQFVSKLTDHLNADIVLGNIQNAKESQHWLGYTYLYFRMKKNPTLYGLPANALSTDTLLQNWRADLVHSAATILDKNNLMVYDRKSGNFEVTDLGRMASKYYITHQTIATYNEHLNPTMSDIELCRLLSLSEEFKYIPVREDEKKELAKLLDRAQIRIKEGLEDPSAKINVLLQAHISQLKPEGCFSLTSDMDAITKNAGRLMHALFEIVLEKRWARLAEKALNLCKMIKKRIWSFQTPLRQFDGIEKYIFMKLEKKDMKWERYYDLSSQELGELVCDPMLGRNLYKCIHQFPKLNLAAHVQLIDDNILRVELTITPDFQWEDMIHGYSELFWVIVEDNDGEYILHHERFLLKGQYINEDQNLSFTLQVSKPFPPQYNIRVSKPFPPQYNIRVVSDRWLGSVSILPVSLGHLILQEKYPPATELLD